jgi:hypothetical protein
VLLGMVGPRCNPGAPTTFLVNIGKPQKDSAASTEKPLSSCD